MLWLLLLISLDLAVGASFQATAVQFSPSFNGSWSAQQVVSTNTQRIVTLIAQAKTSGSSIVVFPEGANGWFQMFTNTKERGFNASETRLEFAKYAEVIPLAACSDVDAVTSPQIKALCQAAQANSITVISNLMDIQACSPAGVGDCPADGRKIWNADVIIEPTGLVARKYYKSHLAGEYPNQQQPAKADAFVYQTTFGAKIGVLICQDILFASTALFFPQGSIDVLVWTAFWGDLNPVVVGMNFLQSYSLLNHVHVIAADLNQHGGGIIAAGGSYLARLYHGEGNCDLGSESCTATLSTPIASPPAPPSFSTIGIPLGSGEPCTFGGPTLGPVKVPAHCFKLNEENDAGLITAADPFAVGPHGCYAKVAFTHLNQTEQYVLMGAVIIDSKPGTLDIPIYRICAVLRCPDFPDCAEYPNGVYSTTTVFASLEIGSTASAPVIYGSIATLQTYATSQAYFVKQPQAWSRVRTTLPSPSQLGGGTIVGISQLGGAPHLTNSGVLLVLLLLLSTL